MGNRGMARSRGCVLRKTARSNREYGRKCLNRFHSASEI